MTFHERGGQLGRATGATGATGATRVNDVDVAALPCTVVVLLSSHPRADLPPGLDDCRAAAFTPKQDVDVDALVVVALETSA